MNTLNINNNDERIQRLKKRYTDKSLSRSERHEAFSELARELYKRDPRKSISLKKQTLIDSIMFLVCGLNFVFMGVVENLGIKMKYHDIISPVEKVFILLILASLVFYAFVHIKYKNEPDDELSAKHKLTARSCGSIFICIVLFALIIVYFSVMNHDSIVIKYEAALFCFVGSMFISRFIDGIVFVILEGKGCSAGDDEDEEEEK